MGNGQQVEELAAQVAQRLSAAKKNLQLRMEALGLNPAKGWRLSEELRHTLRGTEWVFRPVHLREAPPEDLEARVAIDHDGRPIQDA
jgi:hypothetical protein